MLDHARAAECLVKVMQDLSLARDLSTVMKIVRTAARMLTGADGATFVLRERGACYYAEEEAISPLWKGQRFPLEACISGWAMIHRESVAIRDIYADQRIPADAYRPTFVKSLVMVPIRAEDPVGAIGTYWADHHVASTDEIQLLATLANSTSIAMENVQLYAELERRVEERTAELVRVQRQKEELAQLIVHDLRSPATSIMLTSQLAQADDSHPERWQRVHRSAEAIHRMTMNLLDVMRSEEGTFAPRLALVETTAVIVDVAEQMAPVADAKGKALAVIDHAGATTIVCDAEMVRRLLQNLIDNAISHSPPGGRVTLEIRTFADYFELRVADEGPGIPAELRETVFERGKQLEPGRGEHTSRGLGLAFCQLVTSSHGGSIKIEANEPHGSIFIVQLPLAGPSAARAAASATSASREIPERRASLHDLSV
jgi:signal transduction histidine kinase